MDDDTAAVSTRAADPADLDEMVALLPRLADYDLPANRTADMFWSSDARLLASWSRGDEPEVFVRVATVDSQIVGVAMVTMGEDHFSHQRCGHLEAVAIAPVVDGLGVGRRLIEECEEAIVDRGGELISLHVMGNNHRARRVYERLGFAEEMIRATKFLDSSS